MLRLMMLTTALVACAGEKEEELVAMMEVTIVPDHPEVLPRLNLPLTKHLALTTMGSSSPTFPATQKRTVETWSIISILEDPYDPAEVLSPGKCNIMIKLAEGYEDGIELSDDPILCCSNLY